MTNQTIKADAGKPKLTLVPQQIIYAIAAIREYGNRKYPEGGPDNWKGVEPERYRDAAFRHLLAYIRDPEGTDEESGLPHLWHLACNIAFLCELEKDEYEQLHNPMPHGRRHRSRAVTIRRMLGSCHRKIRGWLRALSNLVVRRKL